MVGYIKSFLSVKISLRECTVIPHVRRSFPHRPGQGLYEDDILLQKLDLLCTIRVTRAVHLSSVYVYRP